MANRACQVATPDWRGCASSGCSRAQRREDGALRLFGWRDTSPCVSKGGDPLLHLKSAPDVGFLEILQSTRIPNRAKTSQGVPRRDSLVGVMAHSCRLLGASNWLGCRIIRNQIRGT